jgi:hypothetical protein
MATDESSRLHLYDCARTTWGDEAAGILMTTLPRDPDRFATKDDLLVLGAELRSEIAAMGASVTRTIMFGTIASNATLVGLVFAAVKLG